MASYRQVFFRCGNATVAQERQRGLKVFCKRVVGPEENGNRLQLIHSPPLARDGKRDRGVTVEYLPRFAWVSTLEYFP
jgi:hypothetical protein